MTTSIWARVLAALTGLGLPIAANQYIVASGSQYPAAFVVYMLVDSVEELSADDVETERTYRVQVSYYSTSGLAAMPDIAASMVAAGFGKGPVTEIPFNTSTGHYGLVSEYLFLDNE